MNRGYCIDSHFTHICSDTKLRWCFEEKNKDTAFTIVELHAVNIYKGSHLLTKREGNGEIFFGRGYCIDSDFAHIS